MGEHADGPEPGDPAEPPTGLATAAVFLDPSQALVAQSVLEAYGLASSLRDAHYARLDWWMSVALGGVRLQVPAAQLVEARALLAPQLGAEGWARREVEGVAESLARRLASQLAFMLGALIAAALILLLFLWSFAWSPARDTLVAVYAVIWLIAESFSYLAPFWARGRAWRGPQLFAASGAS